MTDEGDETNQIQRLAVGLNSRIAAESRVAKAQGIAWVCAGTAIALCLTSFGCAFAFVGYSHMLGVGPAAEMTARALADAFRQSKVKAVVSGRMSLSPDSELRLAAGQRVRLNEDAVVKLDPSSSVRIVGNLKVDVPQPSKEQLQLDATTKTNELPFTNYTIFRDVDYDKGQVVTGWNYDLADTTRPRVQYCYYQQIVEKGLSAKYMLAINNSPHVPSALTKVSFNFEGALSNCIWFSGY